MAVSHTITYADNTTATGAGTCTVFANIFWELFHPTALTGKKVVRIVVVASAGSTFELDILPKSGTTRTMTQVAVDGADNQVTSADIEWLPVTVAGKTGQKIKLKPPSVASQQATWRFAGLNVVIGGRPPVIIGQV